MTDSYIALDLETTGLSPAEDRILEIGAVKVIDGEIRETYGTLLNPGLRISPRIRELTGLTDEMAAGGKDTRTAVAELVEFCGDLPLLGHNILFDYSFVKKNAVNFGLEFEKAGIDTLKIARKLLPDMELRAADDSRRSDRGNADALTGRLFRRVDSRVDRRLQIRHIFAARLFDRRERFFYLFRSRLTVGYADGVEIVHQLHIQAKAGTAEQSGCNY